MKAAYDVVIIGSGFGGSITACRLAEAQKKAGKRVSVCVLERGKRYNMGEFPRDPFRPKDWWWRNGGKGSWTGLLDFRSFNNISVLQGSGIGGTSLIYLDVQINAFDSTFEFVGPEKQKRWPNIDKPWKEELEPHYKKVYEMLRPSPIPDPTLKTLAMKAAARGIGEPDRFTLPDLAIYWGKNGGEKGVLNENPYERGGPPQFGCAYCGECFIGCNTHSKNTVDLNYLWFAQKAGAEVYSQHKVVKIEQNSPDHRRHPNGYTVHYQDLRWGLTGTVSAKILILAAGSLGSTELLLQCRDRYGTLKEISDKLGCYFSGNGDFGAVAFETKRLVEPMHGPTITAVLDFRDKLKGHGFLIEDGGFPDFLRASLRDQPGGFAFWRPLLRRLVKKIFRERGLADQIFNLLDFEAVQDALLYLVMGHDAADGKMYMNEKNELAIDWKNQKSMEYFREIEKTLREVTESDQGLAGNLMLNPTWSAQKQLVTVHPLGGCPMGDDPSKGVVDAHGEVFGYKNLFVADGAIVPSAIGPNPSKTIAALAERISDRIRQGCL